MILNK